MINLYTIELVINIVVSILAYVIIATLSGMLCAWTAKALGDSTAYDEGFTSCNPLVHVDLWGMLCLVSFGLGWGTVVPFDYANISEPYKKLKIVVLELMRGLSYLIVVFIMLTFLIKMMSLTIFDVFGSLIRNNVLALKALAESYPYRSSLQLVITLILSKAIYLGVILGTLNLIRFAIRTVLRWSTNNLESTSYETYMMFAPLVIFVFCGAQISMALLYGLAQASISMLHLLGC